MGEKKPKGFVIYPNIMALLKKLPHDSCGIVIQAAIDFFQTGEIVDGLDPVEEIVFTAISTSITESEIRYEAACEKKRIAMEKRWAEHDKAIITNSISATDNNSNEYISIDNYRKHSNKNKNYNQNKNKNYNQNENENKNIINNNIESNGRKTQKFTPPTLEDIVVYGIESGHQIDAERFIDYYTANGWKVGKNPMKDWRAAVRNWDRQEKKPEPVETDEEKYRPLAEGELPWK